MNLSQLATTVGQRSGLVGPNDIIACQNFLTMRHDQLWRSYLWKDSLCEYLLPINPATPYVPTSNYLPTKGHLVLPSIISKVIACRTNQNMSNVTRPMMYYRISQDQFTQSGMPYEFFLLPSCVWEFDKAQTVSVLDVDDVDANQVTTLDLLQPDGVSVVRYNAAISTGGTTVAKTERIDSMLKPVTQNAVSLIGNEVVLLNNSQASAEFQTAFTTGEFIAPGTNYTNSDIGHDLISATLNVPAGTTLWFQPGNSQTTIIANSVLLTAAGSFTAPNGLVYIQQAGTSTISPILASISVLESSAQTTVAASAATSIAGNPDPSAKLRVGIIPANTYAATFPVNFTGTVTWNGTTLVLTPGLNIITMNPTDTSAPKCQRIRFVMIPNTAITLRVLGKRITPPFSAATDTPGVSGMDNILMELAYHDMLLRDERGGTQEDKDCVAMAAELTKQLVMEEVEQAAFNSRIMPEGGFGGCEWYGYEERTKASPY